MGNVVRGRHNSSKQYQRWGQSSSTAQAISHSSGSPSTKSNYVFSLVWTSSTTSGACLPVLRLVSHQHESPYLLHLAGPHSLSLLPLQGLSIGQSGFGFILRLVLDAVLRPVQRPSKQFSSGQSSSYLQRTSMVLSSMKANLERGFFASSTVFATQARIWLLPT